MDVRTLMRSRWDEKELCLGPTNLLIPVLPIVFPVIGKVSWKITIPALFILGIEKIIDVRACWTDREAGVEPPSSSVMLSTVEPSVLVPISVNCENQVKMFYSLG